MENHQHVPELELAVSQILVVPQGARLQDECPKCGGKAWKVLYCNNSKRHQVRVQCLRTDCGHKYQRFPFRKSHPGGYKKVKGAEPEEYVGHVKVCSSCGCSDAKFYSVNNNDVHQARYKCLNSACKKIFTPFGKPRVNKRNHQVMTTTDLQDVDDNKFLERSIMNNLQYPEIFDPQYSTPNDSLVPCAHNAFQNYIEEEERARLTSLINPHHESRNVTWPPCNFQQDDRANVLRTPATWNMQLEDHRVTTLMPTPTILQSKDQVPTVVAPNLTPTTLQEEDRLVHDASTTLTSLHEDREPAWSIPADYEYWNNMENTEPTSPTNALDTVCTEEEFDSESYISSVLNP